MSTPRAQALRAANQPVPVPVRVRGLVDTGASGTCIDPASLQTLGLSPTGQAAIHTPSTAGTAYSCPQYDVSLVLIHPRVQLTLHAVPIIASSLKVQGIEALIGRDVLSRCLFVYDGAANTFALAF